MRPASLKEAVTLALAEAQQAGDPRQNALMDRTDLEQTIARLSNLLEKVSRACDGLEGRVEALSEKPLLLDHLDCDWIRPPQSNL